MIKRIPGDRQLAAVLGCVLTMITPMTAAENSAATDAPSATPASATGTASSNSETEQLRRMLADQQRQIDELRRMLIQQGKTPANAASGAGAVSAPQTAAAPAVLLRPRLLQPLPQR